MDIAGLSMSMANYEVANKVSMAVLDKAMETNEKAGASLINMMDRSMELSVNPNIGGNFDMSI